MPGPKFILLATMKHCIHMNQKIWVGISTLNGRPCVFRQINWPLWSLVFSSVSWCLFFLFHMTGVRIKWKLDTEEVSEQQRDIQSKRLLLLSPNAAVSTCGEPPSHIHLSTLVTLAILGYLFGSQGLRWRRGGEKGNNKNLFIKHFTSLRWKFLGNYHGTS